MGTENIQTIKENIVESAIVYFTQTGEKFSDDFLSILVDSLVDEYKGKRQYPAYFTDEQIEVDVTRYFNRKKTYFAMRAIPEIVGKIGAEGQKTHSENGINREWNPEAYLADVIPYCEVI